MQPPEETASHPPAPPNALPSSPNRLITTPAHPPATISATLSDAWARNLHDNIAQYLTALTLGLRALREPTNDLDRVGMLDKLDALAEAMRKQFYQAIDRLRQDAGGGDLAADLERISSTWAAYGSFRVEIRFRNLSRLSLPSHVRMAIVNVVKEAVTNAAKHAAVSNVQVRASMTSDLLKVAVLDRGCGFESPRTPVPLRDAPAGGNGLRGMYENARAIGGILLIRSRPGLGTLLLLEVPLTSPENRPPAHSPTANSPAALSSAENSPAASPPHTTN